MANLVGLKVRIGKAASGHAQYPQFNTLAAVIASGMDWAAYIDRYGSGWLYDCCGHDEEEQDSPRGMQWGMIFVPDEFAEQAVAAFPGICSVMTRQEAETFYNDKHAKEFEEEEIDIERLNAIKRKNDLGVPLTAQDQDAIDPNSRTRGVRKNRRKKFLDFTQDRGFNVRNLPGPPP